MEFVPDQKKKWLAYMWACLPLAVGLVYFFIDASDGAIFLFSLFLLLCYTMSSLSFLWTAKLNYSAKLTVNNIYIMLNDGKTIKQIAWDDVDKVTIHVRGKLTKLPWMVFEVGGSVERSAVFRLFSLSDEKKDELIKMVETINGPVVY